ncbi:MAG: peroxiredoxin [Spirochaetia bacterium]|nr:peroxiredoxin [Spirochaetia bacterium]
MAQAKKKAKKTTQKKKTAKRPAAKAKPKAAQIKKAAVKKSPAKKGPAKAAAKKPVQTKKGAPVKAPPAGVAHKGKAAAPAAKLGKAAPAAKTAKAGTRVADQSVILTDGSSKKLSELAGQAGLVLYFYPKDNTPGCTKEACSFRDNLARLTSLGYGVAGVSPDAPKSHANFTQGYSLNFPLIADTSKALCESLGVWQEKSLYGRKYMGVARTTFILGSDLTVKRVYENVKVDGHVEAVMADLKSA